MKKLLIIPLLFCVFGVWGQTRPVKVVFDVTSKEEATHQAVMRHVIFMAEAYPESEFSVVVYGGALPMMLKENSIVGDEISKFKDSDRVSFIVCEGTMKRYNVEKSQLIPFVKTVPDGILEIVLKQADGWGYIKEAHH